MIEDIKQGRVKIPKFQRPYVWEDEQALKLLDSVASSFLLRISSRFPLLLTTKTQPTKNS
ncbi:DUF262 domain-containing protein [Caballeronia choica]|uniref:DUF262 domain-containing protein n=1 Tax=Caballeronia choica TaxID=326476 RepID=UPI000B3ED01B